MPGRRGQADNFSRTFGIGHRTANGLGYSDYPFYEPQICGGFRFFSIHPEIVLQPYPHMATHDDGQIIDLELKLPNARRRPNRAWGQCIDHMNQIPR